MGWMHCTPKTMNAAGFYLLLLALFSVRFVEKAEGVECRRRENRGAESGRMWGVGVFQNSAF